MKLRLSNGYSRAVEFSASSETSFRVRLSSALSEFISGVDGKTERAELHVQTDNGIWLSPLYPRSNATVIISRFPSVTESESLWKLCNKSNSSGTWFEYELKTLVDFIIR